MAGERVLALDLGFRVGFGALGAKPNYVQSGSFALRAGSSEDMGHAFIALRTLLAKLVAEHKPTALAVARTFVTGDPKKRNPVVLRPIMGFSCRLEEYAIDAGLPLHKYAEPDARRAFLARVPRRSGDIKLAAMDGCRLRGWPVCDDHAADALCIADFALAHLMPLKSHERMPLFVGRLRYRRGA